MPTYSPPDAECLVFTKKEGLLSPVAHDLKLRVTRFEVTADPSGVSASFDAASLEVVCCMKDGREAPGTLSSKDKAKIASSIDKDVLKPKRHGKIRFASTSIEPAGDGYRITGDLTLGGRTRPITASAVREGDRLVAELVVNQPDFGIKPFTAMLGALKVAAAVTIRLSVPA